MGAWTLTAQGTTDDEPGLWANLKRILLDERAGCTGAYFAGQTMATQYPPPVQEQLADALAQVADRDAQLEQAAERIASLQGELSVAQTINQIAASNAAASQEAPA